MNLHSLRFITEVHKTLRGPNKSEPRNDALVLPGKRYDRFPQIELPEAEPLSVPLLTALQARRSSSEMSAHTLPLSTLATFLGFSLREQEGKRPHPSGGGKYPLETYLFAFNVAELSRASFHYRPDKHVLEELWPLESETMQTLVRGSGNNCARASALIVLTAMWQRSALKYGTFAFELALIEAGHIGQNLLLSAAALKLACRPFGGYRDDDIVSLLDLDSSQEQPIYAIAIGK